MYQIRVIETFPSLVQDIANKFLATILPENIVSITSAYDKCQLCLTIVYKI